MITDFKPDAACRESGQPPLDQLAKHAEITADILAIEEEAKGLLDGVLKLGSAT